MPRNWLASGRGAVEVDGWVLGSICSFALLLVISRTLLGTRGSPRQKQTRKWNS